MKISLAADPILNLDAHHQSLPVVLRVYQLSDPRLFQSANFTALWKDDELSLGKDMLAREEILLLPGETQNLNMKQSPQAEYFAVLGLFRETKRANWRVIQPIKKTVWGRCLHIVVKDKNIQIQQ
jgi:type VI secretion system protein VasD